MTDTRPMKRLPDSPPRFGKLLLPILMLVGIDFGLLVLASVLQFTPLYANYPQNTSSPAPYQPATVWTVTLPTLAPRHTAHSAPVTHQQTAPVHQVNPTTHKPPATPTAVPTPSPSATMTKTALPTPTPSDSESGD